MDSETAKGLDRVRAASALHALAGMWLLAATFVLRYSDEPAAPGNAIVVGGVIVCLAGLRYLRPRFSEWASWTITVMGLWLTVSPYALEYSDAAVPAYNSILTGVLVFCVGLYGALAGDWSRGERRTT